MDILQFKRLIADQGRQHFRDMPWRQDTQPYSILVSELMLQQTQVDRVRPKFERFMERFPDVTRLAKEPLSAVLQEWQGLGYNRRAKFLHQAAQQVVLNWSGHFPEQVADLMTLPGVGRNTAGAIAAYAFNQPAIFVETNVRTVYFHHFFDPLEVVDDAAIAALLAETLDRDNPRVFYWAVMDYGSWLKRQGVKNVGQSKHYVKQSKLEGSVRQVRGQIIKALTDQALRPGELEGQVDLDERFDQALNGLMKDGLVVYDEGLIKLAE